MRRRPSLSRRCGGLLCLLALLPQGAAVAGCSVTSAGLAFGIYNPTASSPLDSAGTITVSCDSLAAYTLALSPGAGSFASRQMSGPAHVLRYNLYVDVLRLIVWGDGSAATSLQSVGLSLLGPHTVYGRVPAQQNVGPGAYGDNVVITVSY